MRPGDRVAIVAENRPEWCVADLAILTAGGVTVPTYTTNTVEDHAYVLQHSEAAGVVYAGKGIAKRLLPAVGQSPSVRFAIRMDGPNGEGEAPVPTLGWQEALAEGGKAPRRGPRDRRSGRTTSPASSTPRAPAAGPRR